MVRRQFYLLYEVQKYMPICVWRRNDPTAAGQVQAAKPCPGGTAFKALIRFIRSIR